VGVGRDPRRRQRGWGEVSLEGCREIASWGRSSTSKTRKKPEGTCLDHARRSRGFPFLGMKRPFLHILSHRRPGSFPAARRGYRVFYRTGDPSFPHKQLTVVSPMSDANLLTLNCGFVPFWKQRGHPRSGERAEPPRAAGRG
jgi:hypothetical protein